MEYRQETGIQGPRNIQCGLNSIIKGIQKITLIDYPGKVASTLFTGGCNFRCGFCYNHDLVVGVSNQEGIPFDEVIAFLRGRSSFIDGVCITGGEPTLHAGLYDICTAIKELGLHVKLDTNGTRPDMISRLIDAGVVDYIAMDIKCSPEKYAQVTNVEVDMDKIRTSVEIIMKSGIDYEFRSTIVPDMFTDVDIHAIGTWIRGARRYCIQQFKPMETALEEKYQDMEPLATSHLLHFQAIMNKYVAHVEIR